jgi:hypothetical protein
MYIYIGYLCVAVCTIGRYENAMKALSRRCLRYYIYGVCTASPTPACVSIRQHTSAYVSIRDFYGGYVVVCSLGRIEALLRRFGGTITYINTLLCVY